jgi:hypothetical protein
VEHGFFNLLKDSFIQLEKQAKEYILRNIKETAHTRANLVNQLKYFAQDTGKELTFSHFLSHHHLSLYDFYGRNGNRIFSRMLVDAGIGDDYHNEDEK